VEIPVQSHRELFLSKKCNKVVQSG